MNEKQNAQWLYAKSLELAILIKGKPENLPKEPFMYNDVIANYYDDLAIKIARKIVISAKLELEIPESKN
jgi:hypothetical protein